MDPRVLSAIRRFARLGSVALAIAVASTGSACSGGGSGADTGEFTTTPAAVVTTDAGSYRIAVHSAPDAVPTRGNNSLRLVVTRASDGAVVSGLALDVVPWMPAMGHGASVKPTVAPGVEPGTYTVSNVNLFMPGLWEIRTTIGGETSDHVTAQFDVH
jgi:hypothetical protein